MILVANAEVYGPEPMGRKDVLVAGGRIVAVGDSVPAPSGVDVERIDAAGLRLVPGLVDGHVHIAGAGGEGGPATRTPELSVADLLEAGVTSVVGLLGTDGHTRTVESVLMRAKGLRAEGLSAWIFTGAYTVPPPTILGDVARDIALFEEVIGAGEIAISDHRSSCPSREELARIAARARVGGMLGGKAGIVCLHMGDADDPFRPVREVVDTTEIPAKQFLPTHVNRNPGILEAAKEWGRDGNLDLTASSGSGFRGRAVRPAEALAALLDVGVPLEHVTMSSDGGGSLPAFDADGRLERLDVARPAALLDEIRHATAEAGVPLERMLALVTENPARILGLMRKGRIAAGADADLVALDAELRVRHLVANGRLLVRDGERTD
jgi:beta-aspartyl-dipeptidase (metallo-type)